MLNIWINVTKNPNKIKLNLSNRLDPNLSPKEEDKPTKGMTHSFRSILNNHIISAEAVVSNIIKIGENNVQLGDIFAKNVADITTMNQCVVRYQSFLKKQDHTSVNELNQNHGNASTRSSTIPKQIVDVVDLTNSVDNLSQTYRKQLYLNTLDAEPKLPTSQSNPTEMFSNIEIESILVHGKQDTGAEINAMPLNVYDQLNMKLNSDLQLKSCNDVKIVGYTKQSVSIVGKIAVTCIHANVIKKCLFYVTDITDTKVILGLNFCRAFNLVKVICDEKCACQQVTIDAINGFPQGLDVPNANNTKVLPPVDVHLKLHPDCKDHILELYPDLFDGVGTMEHALVKLDVDQAAIPVVQPLRKVPQAMVEPLKKEIERMECL